MKDINVTFGRPAELNRKRNRNKKRNDDESGTQQWIKKIIFFDLPYWESNLLRHNLDVMHIEKNVFENIIYTLLNDKEKSKDHIKDRIDLQDMAIWCGRMRMVNVGLVHLQCQRIRSWPSSRL